MLIVLSDKSIFSNPLLLNLLFPEKKFLLSGRVDGMVKLNQGERKLLSSKLSSLSNETIKADTLTTPQSRNLRVLAQDPSENKKEQFDQNQPILAISYAELRKLQHMEEGLMKKTKDLLKTLTYFPKNGVQVKTKIVKIYQDSNDETKNLGNGDSKDVKFVY